MNNEPPEGVDEYFACVRGGVLRNPLTYEPFDMTAMCSIVHRWRAVWNTLGKLGDLEVRPDTAFLHPARGWHRAGRHDRDVSRAGKRSIADIDGHIVGKQKTSETGSWMMKKNSMKKSEISISTSILTPIAL